MTSETVADGTTQAAVSERPVTLGVSNMYRASCPFIAQCTPANVPRVIAAQDSLRARRAIGTYDGARTAADAVIGATSKIGYPSEVVSQYGWGSAKDNGDG